MQNEHPEDQVGTGQNPKSAIAECLLSQASSAPVVAIEMFVYGSEYRQGHSLFFREDSQQETEQHQNFCSRLCTGLTQLQKEEERQQVKNCQLQLRDGSDPGHGL